MKYEFYINDRLLTPEGEGDFIGYVHIDHRRYVRVKLDDGTQGEYLLNTVSKAPEIKAGDFEVKTRENPDLKDELRAIKERLDKLEGNASKTEDKVSDIPEPGSTWRHTSGCDYHVITVSNLGSVRLKEYPITIVYESLIDSKVWSRPLSKWHQSMTEVKS